MTKIVDGNRIAEEVEKQLETGIKPLLGIILVGDRKTSEVFVEKKVEACERNGYRSRVKTFPEDVEQEALKEAIEDWNRDTEVNGILVQLPLPKHIEENQLFKNLKPAKDVDGLTPENLGKILRGCEDVVPAAVSAIIEIIEQKGIKIETEDVVIINNSSLIGKPLSMALTNRGATVSLCHKKTKSLRKYTQDADMIITATGEPGLIEDEMLSENALVIDASYGFIDGSLVSDTEKLEEDVDLSPVPGGVGPVTVAKTLENLVKCYRKQV